MITRIFAITIKEFRHIVRDWQTLLIIIAMPVVMMFLYGYALSTDIKDLPVVIELPQSGPTTAKIIESIDNSSLFSVQQILPVVNSPQEIFRKYKIKALFRFGAEFERQIGQKGSGATVQVLIDGSDPNTGTVIKNSCEALLLKAVKNAKNRDLPDLITVNSRILYNQEQKSALYFVPGLMAIILLMISALLTSLAITREKELGTMEQLLVSPLKPNEIILGKIIPYVLLAALDGILIMLVGYFVFGVSVAGNIFDLIIASTVYIVTALAIGLLVSTVAKTQQQAMLIVLPLTMLPTIILSGFIFPIASFPWPLKLIAHIVPATYFLTIIRAIVLKGIGITFLWSQMTVLLVMSILLLMVSVKKFRVKL